MTPVHVVVTGASGSIGTALLSALAASRPDWAVTGVVRRPPAAGESPYDAAAWLACDIGDPAAAETLTTVMRGADAVLHLAWAIAPSHDVDLLTSVNLDGSRHVLDAALAAGVPHLVHASSLGAYSPAPDKRHVREDWPTGGIPTSLYSRHKVAVERMLDDVERTSPGLVVTRLRPGLVLQSAAGAEISRYFLGSALLTPLLGRLPLVPLPPDLRAPAVHATDLADLVVRVLDVRPHGGVNVAGDEPVTTASLAAALGGRPVPVPRQALRAVVDLTWRARIQPTDAGWVDIVLTCPMLDTTRARDELGWVPRRRVDEALAELVGGMCSGAGTGSPALEPRNAVRDLLPNRIRQRF